MKLRTGLAAALIGIGVPGAMADDAEIIKLRQRVMGTNGQAAKVAVAMIKGDMPFDATVAAAAAMSIAHDNEVFTAFFPAGTGTGDTKAGPEIWSDPAGFKAASDAAVTAAMAAAAAAAEGQEAFGKAFEAVGAACGACHKGYRKS